MTDFILAADTRAAHATARLNWRWRQTGPMEYEMPDGRRARIVTRLARDLRGISGDRVFLAYGWWNLSEHDQAVYRVQVAAGFLTPTEPEIGPAYR